MVRALQIGCLAVVLAATGAVAQPAVMLADGARAADPRCSLPPERGACKAHVTAFHFAAGERARRPFVWGGCGTAPFASREECERVCIRP